MYFSAGFRETHPSSTKDCGVAFRDSYPSNQLAGAMGVCDSAVQGSCSGWVLEALQSLGGLKSSGLRVGFHRRRI